MGTKTKKEEKEIEDEKSLQEGIEALIQSAEAEAITKRFKAPSIGATYEVTSQGEKDIYTTTTDFNMVEALQKALAKNEQLKREKSQSDNRIFQLEEENTQLHYKWQHDGLTGLVRKEHRSQKFSELFQKICRIAKTTNKSQHIAYVINDLDDFGSQNATYGHDRTDTPIHDVAQVVLRNSRDLDVTIRFGGDENIYLLGLTNTDGALKFTNNISEQLEGYNPNEFNRSGPINRFRRKAAKELAWDWKFKKDDGLSLSYGISNIEITPEDAEYIQNIYKKNNGNETKSQEEIGEYLLPKLLKVSAEANHALYHAKFLGKGQAQVFNAKTMTEGTDIRGKKITYDKMRELYTGLHNNTVKPKEYLEQGGILRLPSKLNQAA